jgi:hypothetical protein
MTAGGVWTTGEDGDPEAFYDFYSNGTNPSLTSAKQRYFSGGCQLQVLEPDNLTGDPKTYPKFGTQGVYYESDGVKIDNYYLNPVIGNRKKRCEPPTPLF